MGNKNNQITKSIINTLLTLQNLSDSSSEKAFYDAKIKKITHNGLVNKKMNIIFLITYSVLTN